MKDKIVLISGANAGIGFASAKALLKKGAHVVMFCRNLQKAEDAKKELKSLTGNENIDVFQVDFESFESVERACNAFLAKYDKLDVLLNNAGATYSDFELTQEGLERTMAVNHFGYYLMAYYLLPALKNAENARIVNVASKAHYGVTIDFQTINTSEKYMVFKQYQYSKLANVLFTKHLAEIVKPLNITVNCLHPGVVKTQIGNKSANWFHSFAWSMFAFFGLNPDKGAETSIYLASSEEVKNITGKYFDKCKPYEGSDVARDKNLQQVLWDWTEKMSGKKFVL
jgi:NAD(P)-dependent dehydrogenase (short-subunit alcohol dehydrogenase family)